MSETVYLAGDERPLTKHDEMLELRWHPWGVVNMNQKLFYGYDEVEPSFDEDRE